MIRETHNYALKVVYGNQVEILKAVIYTSEHDKPSGLLGFETEEELRLYMIQNDLIVYEPIEENYLTL